MVNVMALMGHRQQWATGGLNQVGFAMSVAVSMVVFTMLQRFLCEHFGGYLERCIRKLVSSLDPFVQIKFHQNSFDGGPKNHEAYTAIKTYLSANCSDQAPRLKANAVRDIKTPVLCIDEGEGLSDEFNGIKVWWHLSKDEESDPYRGSRKYRYYTLTFRKLDRKVVVGEYLRHVMQVGVDTVAKNRQLKLYSNSSAEQGSHWNYIMDFDHPATFDTVAMELY